MINQQKKKAINIFFSINSKTYPKKKKKAKSNQHIFYLSKKEKKITHFFQSRNQLNSTTYQT